MVVVGIGIEEVLQTLGDFVSQDVFTELVEQASFVVGLDDALNRATDWTLENSVEFHRLLPYT
ncbi:hypothetical protein D3C84_1202350 [compost metagenome]